MANDLGLKHDAGKPRLDLVDSLAIEGLGQALAFGASKYGDHNWRGGIKWMRIIAALLRHTFAIHRGEDIDPESGLLHVDHIGANWMFLSWHMRMKKELDDRWTG